MRPPPPRRRLPQQRLQIYGEEADPIAVVRSPPPDPAVGAPLAAPLCADAAATRVQVWFRWLQIPDDNDESELDVGTI